MSNLENSNQLRAAAQLHESMDNEPYSPTNANLALHSDVPAWRLNLDGTIVAANRLAAWIWRQEDDDRSSSELIGENVFDVFAQNAPRIPAAENEEFWLAEFKLWFTLRSHSTPEVARAPFDQMIAQRADLQLFMAAVVSGEPPVRVWSYSLRLSHAEAAGQEGPLTFDTRVTTIRARDDSELEGYLVRFIPDGRHTAAIVEQKHRRGFTRSARYVFTAADSAGLDSSVTTDAAEGREQRFAGRDSIDIIGILAVVAMLTFFATDISGHGWLSALAFVAIVLGLCSAIAIALTSRWPRRRITGEEFRDRLKSAPAAIGNGSGLDG